MNIPTYLIGAIIFLIGQTTGAIWWGSGLSAEVERLAGVQGNQPGVQIEALEKDAQMCQIEIHNLQKLIADQSDIEDAIKGLDVVRYKVDALVADVDDLKDRSKEIAEQHSQIFSMLRSGGPNSAPSTSYGYD